jgi:RNA polymerase sigma-70 factor (ECF subfamily)
MCKRGADYINNEQAFVLRIAKRKVAKYYALLEKLRIFVPMVTVNDNGDEADLTDLNADAFVSEDFTLTDNLIDDVKQAIRSKSEDVQKIFYLTYDMDLSISEVGQALDMSESCVKNKLYKTLKELRVLFR